MPSATGNPGSSIRKRLADAQLYVLLDGQPTESAFCELAQSLIRAGVHMVQLRDKTLCDRDLLGRACLLRALTRSTGTLFIVNDRPDIARLAEADGVHLGQDDLPVSAARAIMGPQPLVGVSTHSMPQATRAVRDGADYVGCGPTFPSRTKTFAAFPGLDFLRQVSGEIELPAFAIGGISSENLGQVIEAGFRRVAVSSAVSRAGDPAAEATRLLLRLQAA